jgi:glucan phosphoethanolaminetransferase (alkaline phosphatase superfamily)
VLDWLYRVGGINCLFRKFFFFPCSRMLSLKNCFFWTHEQNSSKKLLLWFWFFLCLTGICLVIFFIAHFEKNHFLYFILKYLISIFCLLLLLLSTRANFFSTKHQVLKNSWHSQISIDFDAVSLKMLEKLSIFWKCTIKKLY